MRILFALPGFHSQDRGAEVALLAVARELARGGDAVTVMGGGPERPGEPYRFVHVPVVDRRKFEKWPQFPPFRSDVMWEDATFAAGMLAKYSPGDFDVAITCNFPFTHLALRRPTFAASPLQIFVTQNGDWAARSGKAEFRLFRCDGLVCTNPDYQEANKDRWPTALIQNGIDIARYDGVTPDRAGLGLPAGAPIVLMVSAMIDTKRVADGIRAAAKLPDAHLVVAGDGPLRAEVDALAGQLLPGRFKRLTLTAPDMPRLYASADAFLHMSLLESFGNVFVEAMASGLPIVGHDTPRLRWIVGHRDTLCDTQNLDAVASALRRALATARGAQDPRASGFAWPKIAEKYRAFLSDLLARRTAA
ncbi:MAG: glycosyltransferase family 4 protein [Proteobacteria bacterium]|nr:glycosyltransferase family 4 protein [Pseudomonadota bacterium]